MKKKNSTLCGKVKRQGGCCRDLGHGDTRRTCPLYKTVKTQRFKNENFSDYDNSILFIFYLYGEYYLISICYRRKGREREPSI